MNTTQPYLSHTARIHLIDRLLTWMNDHTEGFETDNIGACLAYLIWAIATNDDEAFTLALCANETGPFLEALKAHPNGLLDELVDQGFLIIP